MNRSQRITGLSRKLLFSLVTLVLVLGALEIGSRLFPITRTSHSEITHNIADPLLRHTGRPDFVGWVETSEIGRIDIRHNAQGLRDHADYGPKPPEVFRILGLGDSFTWGDACPYEDTYLRTAEKLLEGRTSHRVEIVKAGVQAYTTAQELLFLKQRGKAYQPDLITVGFPANDLMSAYPLTADGMGLDRPEDNATRFYDPPVLMRPAYYLRGKSALYQRLRRLMYRNESFYTWIFLNRSNRDTYVSKEWSRGYLGQLEVVSGLLEQLKEEADALGAPVVLIYIPQRFQVLVGKHASLGVRYQADKINTELERLCRELGIEYLDTYPRLLEAAREEPVFYSMDGHLKPHAYRMVGDLLAEYLLRKKLVPVASREGTPPSAEE